MWNKALFVIQPGILVEPFAYRGVAAWRVAPRVAPARSAPLEKMVNFSSRYARILSKIGALRAILVKSARYARSNLASGALRASQHSLTEVGVKWFFSPRGWAAAKLALRCRPHSTSVARTASDLEQL